MVREKHCLIVSTVKQQFFRSWYLLEWTEEERKIVKDSRRVEMKEKEVLVCVSFAIVFEW